MLILSLKINVNQKFVGTVHRFKNYRQFDICVNMLKVKPSLDFGTNFPERFLKNNAKYRIFKKIRVFNLQNNCCGYF